MDDIRHPVSYNDNLERLIKEEGERCMGSSILHNKCAERYATRNTLLAMPIIVGSTLAGTASASSPSIFTENMKAASLAIAGVSIFVGILSTIQSYFAYAKRAEAHRISGIQYSKIHRFISIELALPRHERIQAQDLLKIVREQMERLIEISPPVPDVIVAHFKKHYGDKYPGVAIPDIANGLRAITIAPEPIKVAVDVADAKPVVVQDIAFQA